jgi:transposase
VVATFGDVAALWHIAGHLELLPLLDSTLPAKRRQQGLSCSQYMVLAAINRVVAPTSKLQFADWYRQTALTRLLPADPAWLSSQNFWNHMNRITADHIAAFEKQMSQQLIQRLKLDLRALVYDGTNFFTYINTRTPAELPQRGHNKQKRGDLRQVSLGLLVSTDFHVPLLHWVYAGNVADSVQFRSVTQELVAHYQELAQTCQHITLIFDKGNNSEKAHRGFGSQPVSLCRFVGPQPTQGSTGRAPASLPRLNRPAAGRCDGLPYREEGVRADAQDRGQLQSASLRGPGTRADRQSE